MNDENMRQMLREIPHDTGSMKEQFLPHKWKDWSIARLLGKGACGSVYLLKRGDERSALKVIKVPEDQAEYDRLLREYISEKSLKEYCYDMARRLCSEIDIMMQIREHPNIVRIYDYEMMQQENGIGFRLFIRMEYLTPLPVYQETHFLKEQDYIQMAIELCSALAYCHEKNLIHRDIKPDNIFVTEEGKAKLGDYGMARYLDRNKNYMSIKGSTAYMAPEVFHGKKYDHRVDQYSLAMTLYRECNHGREPFVSVSKSLVTFSEKERANQERLSGKKVPAPDNASAAFWKILEKALHADPNERYDSIASMKNDLVRLRDGSFRHTRLNRRQSRVLRTTLVCVALILAGTASGFAYHKKSRRSMMEQAEKVREYTLAYDSKLMDIFRDEDYAAFCQDFAGYSEEDFKKLCRNCSYDTYDGAQYYLLSERGSRNLKGSFNQRMYYTEVLHYTVIGEYPDPTSCVEASRLNYTILSDGDELYLSMEDRDLMQTLLEDMPQGYKDALISSRNVQSYAFANHWKDENLVYDGVAGFDVTSLWQNEDCSLTAQVLIMNGTDEKRIVNDMDYRLTDEKLGLIAEGKCTDEYEILPGKSMSFAIRIPADVVLTGWKEWSEVEILFEPNID